MSGYASAVSPNNLDPVGIQSGNAKRRGEAKSDLYKGVQDIAFTDQPGLKTGVEEDSVDGKVAGKTVRIKKDSSWVEWLQDYCNMRDQQANDEGAFKLSYPEINVQK